MEKPRKAYQYGLIFAVILAGFHYAEAYFTAKIESKAVVEYARGVLEQHDNVVKVVAKLKQTEQRLARLQKQQNAATLAANAKADSALAALPLPPAQNPACDAFINAVTSCTEARRALGAELLTANMRTSNLLQAMDSVDQDNARLEASIDSLLKRPSKSCSIPLLGIPCTTGAAIGGFILGTQLR
jgi:hypothetical protein